MKTEMTAKLETEIMQLSNMIDGIDIALERAKELREKFFFNYEPFDSSEPLTFSLDTLIELLRKDKKELEASMKELQKRL